jgi:hypothetical protein
MLMMNEMSTPPHDPEIEAPFSELIAQLVDSEGQAASAGPNERLSSVAGCI